MLVSCRSITGFVGMYCRYALMQRCWDENPTLRPSFSDIKTYLENHLSLDPSNPSPRSRKNAPSGQNNKAVAYRSGNDGHENVEMRDVIPGAQVQRNDYLSLHESIPVGGYLAPSDQWNIKLPVCVTLWICCHITCYRCGFTVYQSINQSIMQSVRSKLNSAICHEWARGVQLAHV